MNGYLPAGTDQDQTTRTLCERFRASDRDRSPEIPVRACARELQSCSPKSGTFSEENPKPLVLKKTSVHRRYQEHRGALAGPSIMVVSGLAE